MLRVIPHAHPRLRTVADELDGASGPVAARRRMPASMLGAMM
jgi:hypothetical protein